METKLLIPVDGSNTASRTLEKVIALKERFPNELTLLHVVDVKCWNSGQQAAIFQIFEEGSTSGLAVIYSAASLA